MENKEELYPVTETTVTPDIADTEIRRDGGDTEEYYSLPEGSKSLLKSVLSIIFACLSVGICFVWYLGAALSVTSIVLALLSKKQFGYFGRAAIAGLIIAIFGFVFSGFSLAASLIGLI